MRSVVITNFLASRRPLSSLLLLLTVVVTSIFGSCGPVKKGQPDLPKRDDVWVSTLVLDADSTVRYVGKTKTHVIISTSKVKDLSGLQKISIGDEVEGIRIGAIRCSFHKNDASYGGEQFMWRGRWACMAGRSKEEIENAVGPSGDKRFDYVYVGPLSRIE